MFSMVTTINKVHHAVNQQDAEEYGKLLAQGKKFVITINTTEGKLFIPSHQVVSITPHKIWKESNLLAMREKGLMSCNQCFNVKSIYKSCPVCQDSWEVARTVKKPMNEKQLQEYYLTESSSLRLSQPKEPQMELI